MQDINLFINLLTQDSYYIKKMQDHINYNKKIFDLTIKDFKKEKKHKHARYDHIRDLIAILISSNKIKNIYDFGGNYLTFLDLKKNLLYK